LTQTGTDKFQIRSGANPSRVVGGAGKSRRRDATTLGSHLRRRRSSDAISMGERRTREAAFEAVPVRFRPRHVDTDPHMYTPRYTLATFASLYDAPVSRYKLRSIPGEPLVRNRRYTHRRIEREPRILEISIFPTSNDGDPSYSPPTELTRAVPGEIEKSRRNPSTSRLNNSGSAC